MATKEEMTATYAKKKIAPLTGKQVIFDREFNIARAIIPTRDDGSDHEIELSDNTILKDVAQSPHVRKATLEERNRWIELHGQDEWVVKVGETLKASKRNSNYAPEFAVADGFGRWEAHTKKNGMDAPLDCMVLDTDDPLLGACVSMHINNNQRSISPLDMARLATRLKNEKKINQGAAAKKIGVTPGYMSQVMKTNKLSEKDRARAIENRWSLSKMLSVVDSYTDGQEPENSKGPGGGKAPSRKQIDKLIDKSLACMLGNTEVDFPEGSEYEGFEPLDASDDEHGIFSVVQATLEWVAGRYSGDEESSLLDALKKNGFCPEYHLDLDSFTKEVVKATK